MLITFVIPDKKLLQKHTQPSNATSSLDFPFTLSVYREFFLLSTYLEKG